jgi:CsoR family transcriptional regulator, copper-sensing transcriptional repressor
MKTVVTTHAEQVVHLKRIAGQIRGIQRMIEEGVYCVDILTQIHAAIGAMKRVESAVLKKHLQGCVASAASGNNKADARRKVGEVIDLLDRFRKG